VGSVEVFNGCGTYSAASRFSKALGFTLPASLLDNADELTE
jgi:hypothetical protein